MKGIYFASNKDHKQTYDSLKESLKASDTYLKSWNKW